MKTLGTLRLFDRYVTKRIDEELRTMSNKTIVDGQW